MKILLSSLFFMFLTVSVFAQNNDIIGKWKIDSLKIYRVENQQEIFIDYKGVTSGAFSSIALLSNGNCTITTDNTEETGSYSVADNIIKVIYANKEFIYQYNLKDKLLLEREFEEYDHTGNSTTYKVYASFIKD